MAGNSKQTQNMAAAEKSETWERVKESIRTVVRKHVVADNKTGGPPLWSHLPKDIVTAILNDLKRISIEESMDMKKLTRKAQKYTQTLNERGRKVLKGGLLPDLLQIAVARKKGKLVDVVQVSQKPRKRQLESRMSAGVTRSTATTPSVSM
jgi:hypothetical protein